MRFPHLVAIPLLAVTLAACAEEGGDYGSVMGSGDLLDADRPASDEQAVHQVCGSGSTVPGIDVSYYQGTINWASVANAGIKFAFIRVSDGTGFNDPKFAANWSGAKAHGVKRGVYQFFRSNQDPIAQANLLISKMGALQPGDLPPVVDVESTDGVSNATRASKLHQWLDHVEAATGVKPIIYTGGYFWDDHVGANFSTYPLWHAGYTGGTCPSTISNHWSTWKIWQYTSSGSVSGISGNVDRNKFNGTLAQLNELGVNPCVPTTETCNGADDNCDGVADEGDTCLPRDEAQFGVAQFDTREETDIDGDGVADVCARAAAGVVCTLSAGGAPLSVDFATTRLADANGWADVTNYATLRLGDVTGDGTADLCARANAGIVCLPSTGDGFGANITGPAFSDDSGWSKPEYYGTFRLADVNHDGKADVCARAAAGFRCHLSTGTGFGAAIAGSPAFFANADGFDDPSAYGTIRMADIDGDGMLDACARSPAGVECHRFLGDAWGPAIAGPDWSDARGFGSVKYWSTLRFADLDGDHKDDVCVRASDGIHCRLSTGVAFSDIDINGPALTDDSGWDGKDNYPTLRFADVTGDGKADLCARANAMAMCWPFTAEGNFGARIDGPTFFADAGGFTGPESFRTIRLADVDGDARADLCGRDTAGFSCFLSTGTGFGERVDGPRYADSSGWKNMKYAGTLMTSGWMRCRAMPETCDGADNDCNGLADEGDTCTEHRGLAEAGLGIAPEREKTPEPPPDEEGPPDENLPGDGDNGDGVDATPRGNVSARGGCAATPASTWTLAAIAALALRRRARREG